MQNVERIVQAQKLKAPEPEPSTGGSSSLGHLVEDVKKPPQAPHSQ